MTHKWFAYGIDDGFSKYETEYEAITAAEKLIEKYRRGGVCVPEAHDYDWDEDVVSVCYGKIIGVATERRTIDAHSLDFYLMDINSETVKKLETLLFKLGAMNDPPCFCCGYNGPGYFDTKVHPCADRHHKLCEV